MVSQPFAWLICGLSLSSLYQTGLSFELQPIGSPLFEAGRHAIRDNDFSALDLLSSETFLWGGMIQNFLLQKMSINMSVYRISKWPIRAG